MKLRRLNVYAYDSDCVDSEEHPDGHWAVYDDAMSEIGRLEAENKKLRAVLEGIRAVLAQWRELHESEQLEEIRDAVVKVTDGNS